MAFITNLTVSILTAECRACTAPGVQESMAINGLRPPRSTLADSSSGHQLRDVTAPGDKSEKNRARKLRAKAKAAESKALANSANKGGSQKRALELQNGGVGDSRGAKRQKGEGKGKNGKGPKKHDKTKDGLSICFNYGKGKCTNAACPHQHVCQICEGEHPWPECPLRQQS